jgi:hypothetical protein
MNVQWRLHILSTFITHPLVHMHQKKKIVLEIAAKIASVNGPLAGGGGNRPIHRTRGFGCPGARFPGVYETLLHAF